jgi:small ligand-binding sensory domain FIST
MGLPNETGTLQFTMKWFSTTSEETDAARAVAEVMDSVRPSFGGRSADVAILFVSEHFASEYPRLSELLREALPGTILFGCSAKSVIGGGRELEDRCALSLTVGSLPCVSLRPFHIDPRTVHPATGDAGAWQRIVGLAPTQEPHFVLLTDPFTADGEKVIHNLDTAFPNSRKVGGIASGGRGPGENALFLAEQTYRSGMVGLAMAGNVELDTIVAQGCRPIGTPMFVTRCSENLLQELDGRPALVVLHDLYRQLPKPDQELLQTSLFLGIEMNEHRSEYRRGDFLIRNIIGTDSQKGIIAIGAVLHPTMVVQFHLRDAATSAEDLDQRLARYRQEAHYTSPLGALLFSCLGRGTYLYGRAGHDSEALRRHLGEIPIGGFFCNGEIGPVEGTTFLHGYTSSFGLFRPKVKAST